VLPLVELDGRAQFVVREVQRLDRFLFVAAEILGRLLQPALDVIDLLDGPFERRMRLLFVLGLGRPGPPANASASPVTISVRPNIGTSSPMLVGRLS